MAGRALGRVLRSPTLFEDVIKTILTTNTLWTATRNMTRKLVNDFQRYAGGEKVSFTHLIAWAVVQGLKAYSNMNTTLRHDDGTPQHVVPKGVNLGLAIDVERRGKRTLLVPNVKHAEQMNFAQFLGIYNDIVRRARDNKLEISDFEGTTATLTNPGMIGTTMSVARLMPGQGVIVAVGAAEHPPGFVGMSDADLARMGLSPVMTLTSTYDHRVIQGGAIDRRTGRMVDGSYQNWTQHPNNPMSSTPRDEALEPAE